MKENKTNTENKAKAPFIDRNEIEEMLGEYYDFENVSEDSWKRIDKLVKAECKKRGVSRNDYEAYAKVCDGCVGKVLKPAEQEN